MTHRYTIFAVLLFRICLFGVAQTTTEDEPATKLPEVLVKSKRAWYEGNKAVFMPTKHDKNLATDAVSLVKNMNMGIVYVDRGTIKSGAGRPVAIFINGVRADETDFATFWPKNAVKVEYFETTDDPRFMGLTNVLNFVMKDYVAGGLTKIDADQTVPNDGVYTASSKLVYKKMTYNAVAKGGYSRDHVSQSESTERFDDVWYGGNHYERITRSENSDNSVSRNNDMSGSINARYRTDKMTITHKATLQWKQDPGSMTGGKVDFVPDIIASSASLFQTNSRSLSPKLSGNYNFLLPKYMSLYCGWTLNHSHNINLSSSEEGGLLPIANHVRENLFGGSFYAGFSHVVANKIRLTYEIYEQRGVSTSVYSGYTSSRQQLQSGETKLTVTGLFQLGRRGTISLRPQISVFDYDVNHTFKSTEVMPGINADASIMLSQRNSLSFNSWYFQRPVANSERTDLLLRQSELKWIEGNPTQKSSGNFHLSLNDFWMLRSNLRLSLTATFNTSTNVNTLVYKSGDTDTDGVIGRYENAGNMKYTQNQLTCVWSLFNGALDLSGDLTYSCYFPSRYQTSHISNWRPRVNAYVGLGNFRVGASFAGREKYVHAGGTRIIKTSPDYSLSADYGNGHINLSLELNNIFNKYKKQYEWERSGPYSVYKTERDRGRNVCLCITYTFDYGKKIDTSIDSSIEEVHSSSALSIAK